MSLGSEKGAERPMAGGDTAGEEGAERPMAGGDTAGEEGAERPMAGGDTAGEEGAERPMAGGDTKEWLAFALDLADAADEISMRHFGGPVPAVAKPDGTPVTEADRAIEQLLRARITAAFPGHAVLGEEQGGAIAAYRPTWVIDPVDGTKNFMRGIPIFATLIGLVVGGTVVVGVASAPAMGERWDAALGAGARLNGSPVGVSAISQLADAQVLHGGLEWWREDEAMWDLLGTLTDRAGRTRGFGDFWIHLLVAGGMADVALDRDLRPWDIAALDCIITEAGGRATAWDGSPALASGTLLCTNGLLHDELRALLTAQLRSSATSASHS